LNRIKYDELIDREGNGFEAGGDERDEKEEDCEGDEGFVHISDVLFRAGSSR
jgi:hypothetical protein